MDDRCTRETGWSATFASMTTPSPLSGRETLRRGLMIGVVFGLLLACLVQTLVPVVAKVPGLVICGGDELELVMRRRTSYGVCGGDRTIHYGIVLVVSMLVWTLVGTPFGILIARWRARRA
jgi:hypothetical protein